MTEPTITCPNCATEIKLTESLAAPLIEATRRDYEKRIAGITAEVAKKEEELAKQRDSLADAFGMPTAIGTIAALTFLSGTLVAFIMQN